MHSIEANPYANLWRTTYPLIDLNSLEFEDPDVSESVRTYLGGEIERKRSFHEGDGVDSELKLGHYLVRYNEPDDQMQRAADFLFRHPEIKRVIEELGDELVLRSLSFTQNLVNENTGELSLEISRRGWNLYE